MSLSTTLVRAINTVSCPRCHAEEGAPCSRVGADLAAHRLGPEVAETTCYGRAFEEEDLVCHERLCVLGRREVLPGETIITRAPRR